MPPPPSLTVWWWGYMFPFSFSLIAIVFFVKFYRWAKAQSTDWSTRTDEAFLRFLAELSEVDYVEKIEDSPNH